MFWQRREGKTERKPEKSDGSTAKQAPMAPQKMKEMCNIYNGFFQDQASGALQISWLDRSRKSWLVIQDKNQENSVDSTLLKSLQRL